MQADLEIRLKGMLLGLTVGMNRFGSPREWKLITLGRHSFGCSVGFVLRPQ